MTSARANSRRATCASFSCEARPRSPTASWSVRVIATVILSLPFQRNASESYRVKPGQENYESVRVSVGITNRAINRYHCGMTRGILIGMSTDRDFRKLSPATQAERRRVAVNMVLSGKSRIEVANAIGVNRRFVGEWVLAFEASGEAALAGGRRGRRPGEQKALNRRQEAMIRRLIN